MVPEHSNPATTERQALTVSEAATVLGLSRTKAYELVQAGSLRSFTVGRRRLVPTAAVADFIDACLAAQPPGERSEAES